MRVLRFVLVLVLICLIVPAIAQRMDSKTSKRLLDEGYFAAKQGDLATLYRKHYEVATKDLVSRSGGDASRSLGDYCLKSGQLENAKGWYKRVKQCSDGKIAAIGCQRLAGLAMKEAAKQKGAEREVSLNSAANEFLEAKDCDPSIAPEMNFKAARCLIAIARENPQRRSTLKPQAASLLEASGTEKAFAESLGIRDEAIRDAEVRAKDPTDVGYAAHPLKDNRLEWTLDVESFCATATDKYAVATALTMLGEAQLDSDNYTGAIESAKRVNADWHAHRTLAAQARVTWGGALQMQGKYKQAIMIYKSVIDDFTDKDNFKDMDVRDFASKLITVCERKLVKK